MSNNGLRDSTVSKKPAPLFVIRVNGRICPVCGKSSYSRSGIHPQCELRRADDIFRQRMRTEKS